MIYELIKNNNFTNNLTKVSGKKLVKNGDYTVEDTIKKEITFFNGDTLAIQAPFKLYNDINNTAFKLLDILCLEYKQGKTVIIPLERFMKLRGLTDIKTAREQVKRAYNMLRQISFEYNSKRDRWTSFCVIQDGTISNGQIKITFGDVFFEMLNKSPKMPYPLCLLAYSDKQNPYTYPIARKLIELVNIGRDTIKVSSLLADLPLLKEVEITDRHYKRKIIKAFERDLNEADFIKWCYVNDKGEQIEVKDFLDFKEATIKFELVDYDYNARQKRLEKITIKRGVNSRNQK